MESHSFPQVHAPAPGEAVRVDVSGVPVAIFNVDGELRAIVARCPHRGGPLEKGPVTGRTVTCPWHGSQFDLDTGQVVRGPAVTPVKSFAARVEGDVLVVETP
ncbi:MAG: Rieske 2Fe-2S domain-containing protein [Thermoplasmata archaeon]